MSVTKFNTTSVKSGETATVDFGTSIINASVAVQGYNISFGDTDHHIQAIDVQTGIASVSGSKVTVTATCKMDDHSNHSANGTVKVLVIADCES